jgi:AcrR family transcriptional regulator
MARPTLTDQQVETERKRLSALALQMYRSQGYRAVTLRELAAAAGISYTTPYRYFRSKDELFDYVRADVFHQFGEHLRAADAGDDPLTRLRNMVEAVVDFAERSPEDYRLIFGMRQVPPPRGSRLDTVQKRVAKHVVGVIQAAVDAGQLQGDPLTLAHLAWASIHGLLSLHVSSLLTLGRKLDDLIPPLLDRLFAPTNVSSAKKPTKRKRNH